MRRGLIELLLGTGLLLGPLAYALSLEPRIEVVEIAQAPVAEPAPVLIPVPVIPELPPAAEPEVTVGVDVGPSGPSSAALPFAFVTTAGIVLHTNPDPYWSTGSLRKHAGPGEFRAGKRVDATKIPDELWSLRGRTFDLYGPAGKLCRARLGELTVVAQHDGPSDYDLFNNPEGPELDYDEFTANPPGARQIRSRVWNHPDATRWLVAEVLGDGSCEGALWARDAELPAPPVLHASDTATDLTRRRIAQLKASDEYVERRAEYKAFRKELDDEGRGYYGPWSQIEADFPAKVRTWLDDAGDARLLEIDFGQEEEGCGVGFHSRITHLSAVADGELVDLTASIDPLTIVDVNLDGSFEMLYRTDEDNGLWLHSQTEALEAQISINQEWVCPC